MSWTNNDKVNTLLSLLIVSKPEIGLLLSGVKLQKDDILVFDMDDSGMVSQMSIHRNGKQMRYKNSIPKNELDISSIRKAFELFSCFKAVNIPNYPSPYLAYKYDGK